MSATPYSCIGSKIVPRETILLAYLSIPPLKDFQAFIQSDVIQHRDQGEVENIGNLKSDPSIRGMLFQERGEAGGGGRGDLPGLLVTAAVNAGKWNPHMNIKPIEDYIDVMCGTEEQDNEHIQRARR